MQYVYLDEAGTSAHEPVTVVAGVIVEAGELSREVQTRIAAIIDDLVPAQFRPGFVFHATKLFSGGKYKEGWDLAGRIEVIKAFARIPNEFRMPIVMGMARRGRMLQFIEKPDPRVRAENFDHVAAFISCIAAVDKHLKKHTPEDDVAHLVVEDCENMRGRLKRVYAHFKRHPQKVEATGSGISAGIQIEAVYSASKITDDPRFEAKDQSVMLQLADVAAFTLRSYLSEHKHSGGLIEALYGGPFDRAPYRGATSFSVYWRGLA